MDWQQSALEMSRVVDEHSFNVRGQLVPLTADFVALASEGYASCDRCADGDAPLRAMRRESWFDHGWRIRPLWIGLKTLHHPHTAYRNQGRFSDSLAMTEAPHGTHSNTAVPGPFI